MNYVHCLGSGITPRQKVPSVTYLPKLVFKLVRHKPAPTPVFFLSFMSFGLLYNTQEDELTPELSQLK